MSTLLKNIELVLTISLAYDWRMGNCRKIPSSLELEDGLAFKILHHLPPPKTTTTMNLTEDIAAVHNQTAPFSKIDEVNASLAVDVKEDLVLPQHFLSVLPLLLTSTSDGNLTFLSLRDGNFNSSTPEDWEISSATKAKSSKTAYKCEMENYFLRQRATLGPENRSISSIIRKSASEVENKSRELDPLSKIKHNASFMTSMMVNNAEKAYQTFSSVWQKTMDPGRSPSAQKVAAVSTNYPDGNYITSISQSLHLDNLKLRITFVMSSAYIIVGWLRWM